LRGNDVAKVRTFRKRSDDRFFRLGTGFFALIVVLLVAGIAWELYRNSRLSIEKFGFHFWRTTIWDRSPESSAPCPSSGARCSSVDRGDDFLHSIALGIAIFLSELSPRPLRMPL
jgi:phosphate transport system permease protein